METCCVPVDFSSGRETYHKIWESIQDKEIGVLGRYVCCSHLFKLHVFLVILDVNCSVGMSEYV